MWPFKKETPEEQEPDPCFDVHITFKDDTPPADMSVILNPWDSMFGDMIREQFIKDHVSLMGAEPYLNVKIGDAEYSQVPWSNVDTIKYTRRAEETEDA